MSAPSPILAPWPYPRWIAHSGAGKLAPENTLTAFRLGAQHGYRMFECDAKLSADGVPFLMHDATLENIAHYCIANGFLLNIEIKPTPGVEEKTGQVVGEHAARLWHGQAVLPLFSSFRPEALAGARATAPHIPRALLLDTLWDAALVARVHGDGLRALSYTVNDDWAAQRLIALGTDGIITDRVDFFSPATP